MSGTAWVIIGILGGVILVLLAVSCYFASYLWKMFETIFLRRGR